MNAAIQLLPWVTLIALGVAFANRWIVKPSPRIQKFPKWLRIAALILGCWICTFVASTLSNRIGYLMSDGIAYDEGAKVPYDVIHDGVGSNVMNLFFGWSVGLICWGVAKTIYQKRTDQDTP